ncbi:MAG TPA: peptidylprolyl isomerase [Geobacteraceae bacterium]|nr:peptidylprolyl isomerase [Geobacteraceae bacterium]
MRKLIVSLLLAATLGTAVTAGAEVVTGIAAIVNDEIITIYELNNEYAKVLKEEEKKGALPEAAAKKLRSDVLNAMIDKKLIGMKIKELNIVVSEEEVRQSIEEIKKQNNLSQDALVAALLTQGLTFDQYKAQMKEQLERLRLMSQEVKSKIQVSEREVKEYYEANKSQFREESSYRARHIFLKVDKNASNEQIKKVMEKAANVIAEARTNPDFAGLAKKYSDDPNAAKDGGDLGTFKKGDMLPEIESAVITMNPGEISDLVTTPAGFHIIKLEEKSLDRVKPFDSVKGAIEEILYRKKSEERFAQWVEELRKAAAIEIKQ